MKRVYLLCHDSCIVPIPTKFQKLGLTYSELQFFISNYREIIISSTSYKVELRHLFDYLGLEMNNYVIKQMTIFRSDPSVNHFKDFTEFFYSTWNFCTLSTADFVDWGVCTIYNRESSDKVPVDRLLLMVQDICGGGYRYNNGANMLIYKLQNFQKRCISLDTFDEIWCGCEDGSRSVFAQVLAIQETFRLRFGSAAMWARLTQYRKALCDDELFSLYRAVNPSLVLRESMRRVESGSVHSSSGPEERYSFRSADEASNRIPATNFNGIGNLVLKKSVSVGVIENGHMTSRSTLSRASSMKTRVAPVLKANRDDGQEVGRLKRQPSNMSKMAKLKADKASKSNALQRAMALHQPVPAPSQQQASQQHDRPVVADPSGDVFEISVEHRVQAIVERAKERRGGNERGSKSSLMAALRMSGSMSGSLSDPA